MSEKHYELRVLPMFEEDLMEIVDYITYRLKNPIAAENLIDSIEAAIYERLPEAEAYEPYQSTRERRYPYYRIHVKTSSYSTLS